MAGNKLSAREAALIAQARAELEKKSSAQAGAPATVPVAKQDTPAASPRPDPPAGRVGQTAPAAAPDPVAPAAIEPVAPQCAKPAPGLDSAVRMAALMATARAESERRRQRQKMLYLWVPIAVMSVTGLWTLLWMWHKL